MIPHAHIEVGHMFRPLSEAAAMLYIRVIVNGNNNQKLQCPS